MRLQPRTEHLPLEGRAAYRAVRKALYGPVGPLRQHHSPSSNISALASSLTPAKATGVKMKTAPMMAAIAVALTATPAMAQYEQLEAPTNTGPRVEVKLGWDRPTFNDLLADDGVTYRDSGGKSGLAYGGEVGYDYQVNSAVFGLYAGVEGSTIKDCFELSGADKFCNKVGRNITVGARAGVMLDNTFMLYGKIGYSNGREQYDYTDYNNVQPDYSGGFNRDGYHVGGGLQFNVASRVYNRVDYTYTNYKNEEVRRLGSTQRYDTARHQVTYGLGYRF